MHLITCDICDEAIIIENGIGLFYPVAGAVIIEDALKIVPRFESCPSHLCADCIKYLYNKKENMEKINNIPSIKFHYAHREMPNSCNGNDSFFSKLFNLFKRKSRLNGTSIFTMNNGTVSIIDDILSDIKKAADDGVEIKKDDLVLVKDVFKQKEENDENRTCD
jgi:hypothetical protein